MKIILYFALFLQIFPYSPCKAADFTEPLWVIQNPSLRTLLPEMSELDWLAMDIHAGWDTWSSVTGLDGKSIEIAMLKGNAQRQAQQKMREALSLLFNKREILLEHEAMFKSATNILKQSKRGRLAFGFDHMTKNSAYFRADQHMRYNFKDHKIIFNPASIHGDGRFEFTLEESLEAIINTGTPPLTPEDRLLKATIHEGTHLRFSDRKWKSLEKLDVPMSKRDTIIRMASGAAEEYKAQISGLLTTGLDIDEASEIAIKNITNLYPQHDVKKIGEALNDTILDAAVKYEGISGRIIRPRGFSIPKNVSFLGLGIVVMSYGAQAYAGEPINKGDFAMDMARGMPLAGEIDTFGRLLLPYVMRPYAFAVDNILGSDRAARNYMATQYPFLPPVPEIVPIVPGYRPSVMQQAILNYIGR